MRCQNQKCKKKAAAIDKVDRPDGIIYRKYECKKCGRVFFSMEFPVIADSIFKEDWNANHRLTKLKEKKKQQCGRIKKDKIVRQK